MLLKSPSRLVVSWLCLWLSLAAAAADSLEWNKDKDRLTADVHRLSLHDLLEQVSARTGWLVFLEPGTTHTSSVKFKDLASGEGLRLLLGDLNFALVPQTNGSPRLYVFRTGMNMATERVSTGKKAAAKAPKRVPNQLIVQLKRGMSIDDLARQTGAKVVGRVPGTDIYLLEFPDAAAMEAAKAMLETSPIVQAVDYNYMVDKPQPSMAVTGVSGSTPKLNLNPPPDTGRVIVGLTDTDVQSLGKDLDDFILKKLSIDGATTASGDVPSHGTTMLWNMLTSLAASTEGNTSVQFVCVDVFGADGQLTTYDVVTGTIMAVNNGANVINWSLGSPGESTILANLVKDLSARGIAMIAASGNEPTGEPFYPAGYDGVMAVTATQNGQLAPYANVWSGVNVAAPGSSLIKFGGNTWLSQGTSDSASYMSGFLAGLLSTGTSLSEAQSVIKARFAVPGSPK